jgi:ABC-type microcin C transport system permease subunit YejE
VKLIPGFNFEDTSLDDLLLKAKPNSIKKLIAFRILAVLSLLFCLLVLITEATVIFDPEKTLVYFVNLIL